MNHICNCVCVCVLYICMHLHSLHTVWLYIIVYNIWMYPFDVVKRVSYWMCSFYWKILSIYTVLLNTICRTIECNATRILYKTKWNELKSLMASTAAAAATAHWYAQTPDNCIQNVCWSTAINSISSHKWINTHAISKCDNL